MEWGFDRRFALAAFAISVVIGCGGLGITILWPEEKLLGWTLLWIEAIILVSWCCFEIFQWVSRRWIAFLLCGFAAPVVLEILATIQWKSKLKNDLSLRVLQSQVVPNQSTPPFPKAATPMSVSPSAVGSPKARLLMSKALIIPLTNATTSARGFAVNFFYANRGSMPTTGQLHSESVLVSDGPIPQKEIVRQMKSIASVKVLPELRKGGDEIYPNDPNEHFFTIPEGDDKLTKLASFFDDVMAGKKRVYFLVAIKFRDKSMSPSVVGVSETCGWFLKDFETVHNCGIDKVYAEVEK